MLNRHVVYEVDPRFELVFLGLEEQLKNSKLEQDIKRLKNFATVNEIRAKYDLEALESEAANMVLDSTYMNTAVQLAAQEQGAEDQGAEEQGAEDQGAEEQGAEEQGAEDQGAEDQGAEDQGAGEQGAGSPFAAFFKSEDTPRGVRRFVVEVD